MELEPIITAGAAVAFSVAGYWMSNQRSKPKASSLRSTRSESDLKMMGADAALSEFSRAATEAAAALHNSEGSKHAVPTNSPKGFSRGLNIIGIKDDAHLNVLQRTSLALPSLPTLLEEEPKELDEAQEEENVEESEPVTNKVETEKGVNLDKEKEIGLKEDEQIISDEPEIENKTGVAHIFPLKLKHVKREPKTNPEQEKNSGNYKVRDRAIEWAHTVRDLLEESESEEEEEKEEKEEEHKCLHMINPTLPSTNEELSNCICRRPYAAPKVTQKEESDESEEEEEENEIERLHAMAETLLEKERDLELQMLELYGLKEQQEAIREMENASKLNSTKAKFLSLKVESLEEENERLKRKVSELETVTQKIDENKERINMLKKRLRSEDDNAKGKIALLRESIETLADKEDKSAADYEEMERKLERVKGLEQEVNELKRLNARLEEENSGLVHQLETVQSVASSPMRNPEEQVSEDATSLRETNEKLKQEIAELRDTHYLSVEEVVYLRWLNACLRHELEGKGVASELNKSPSYHSTEKLKQLLQEYSNLGINIDETNLREFDFEYPSSSQAPSAFASPAREQGEKRPKNKANKFLGRIKKMVMGKGSNSHADNDKDKDKDKEKYRNKSPLASEYASVSHSGESSPSSSSVMTADKSPRPSEKRSSLVMTRPKGIEGVESAAVRSSSDLGILMDVRRREPRRYHALHLGHSSMEIDDREREEMMKTVLADLKGSKPTSNNKS